MKKSTVAVLLRIVLVFAVLAAVLGLAFILPWYLRHVVSVMPELGAWYVIGQALGGLAAALVFIALWQLWQVFGTIGTGEAFCADNALRLKRIWRLALADTAFVAGIAFFLIVNKAFPRFLMLCFCGAVFIGLVAAVVCFALSGLVKSAADISDENKLTI